MRRSRAAYYFAIRWAKKNEKHIGSERIATALLNCTDRDFWSEIKRIRSKSVGVCKTDDGISDAGGISKLFLDKYHTIYNSVSYSDSDMHSIANDVTSKIRAEAGNGIFHISISDIISAVRRLKPHKKDGCAGLSSDHFINAGNDLFCHISLLFNAIVVLYMAAYQSISYTAHCSYTEGPQCHYI